MIEPASTVTARSRRQSRRRRGDPALAAFLGLIDRDIAAGRNIRDLPAGLVAVLQRAISDGADDPRPVRRMKKR